MTDMKAEDSTLANEQVYISVKPKKQIKINISNFIYNFTKRLFDIFVGIIGTIILIPLTMVVQMLRIITKENEGPIFYTHLRIGKGGREFKLYKYRSMCMNADEKLKEYLEKNEEARKEYKEYKKLKNDPRISKLGNMLRRTSIDEFPQFLNILLGNMSLVGPRPYLHREIDDMGDYYDTIIKCKPGITGYWQVNGRSETTFEERLKMDKYYVEHKSLWLDIKIIFKTAIQLICGSNAI